MSALLAFEPLQNSDVELMKILFLHGWHSVLGGVKPTYLKDRGHEVINPAIDHDDFDLAVRTAQAEYDLHRPDVVVGSSRGGAVAMNIESRHTPLGLLCPAWKRWGTAQSVERNTTILHSPLDDVIPYEDSQELEAKSGPLEWGLLARSLNKGWTASLQATAILPAHGVRRTHPATFRGEFA